MISTNKFILIGVGLPRNGTYSTKTALEIILPGKCHHMESTVLHHQKEWKRILNDDMSDEEFKNFFLSNGYVAGVDTPMNLFYERMMKVFPNAKVLLNVREPRSWERSMNETIVKGVTNRFEFPEDLFEMLGLFKSYLFHSKNLFGALFRNDRFREMFESVKGGNGVAYYNNWVEEVKRNVPEEKLLVFSVKEGWEPLCKFLDVPVPEQPFPHVNDTATFKARVGVNHRRSMILLYELVSIPIALYMFYNVSFRK
ncbi:uncharacterized protein LOC130657194 [Hydractinia symbiolongicarpus]|uniref:uncharacterized protein LOC130657194 n=1 Tax=Hydractinia symbiolongicarpus TaxID=13093 RepID=UPI0025513A5D|nr:uncharacterized protein LOC130657194 [Hydractinia symbiolongicarpus]